tara:strand:+ start:54 stop:905 length:852 start_codon:yes stop_codon:yes gene_type:complete
MPKITRDHHNLRRNLNLNDKYISNDGGDEGLKVTDAGHTVVTGNLYIYDEGGEYISGNGTNLSITSSNHLTVNASGGDIYMNAGNGIYYFRDAADTDDQFKLTVVGGTGATTLETVSAATPGDGHLSIVADGHVEFDNCAVGFDKLAGTFGTSGVIGDGNDSTDIDFRLSNKYELELTDNIIGVAGSEYLNLIFPATSGNFILALGQDQTGSQSIHTSAWVAYQSDGSTKATNAAFANGTDGVIRWSGGSAPTLTTTADKTDIISIYWDADNQTAFAVASLNF